MPKNEIVKPVKIRLCPPGPGNPRNSEGSIVKLKDGRLWLIYTRFTSGTGRDHDPAHLAGRFSEDGGFTWTDPVTAIEEPAGCNVMSVTLLRLKDGRIALFYLRKQSKRDDCRPVMRISEDEGRTFAPPKLLIEEPNYYVVNNDRAIQLSSGRLLIPMAIHDVNKRGPDSWAPSDAMSLYSDDLGATWKRSNVISPPSQAKSGLQEPGVVELKDGRIWMFIRVDLGVQYQSFSKDGGATWSPPSPTDLPSPLSPASVRRIPDTGDLLIVWNRNGDLAGPRAGLRTPFDTAISRDEAATWEHVRTLEDDPGGWYCYTSILFDEGRAILSHCAGQRATGGLNLLQVTLVPVKWLYGG